MFNKELSDSHKLGIINGKMPLKRVGATLLTFTMLLGPAKNIDSKDDVTGDFEKYVVEYQEQVKTNQSKKQYDEDLMMLYRIGKYSLEGKNYGVNRVYLVYGYDSKKNFVCYLSCPRMCSGDMLTHKDVDITAKTPILLSSTTLFIELLQKKLITYDEDYIMSFDMSKIEEINKCVNNWDGKLHNSVPELDLFQEEDMSLITR